MEDGARLYAVHTAHEFGSSDVRRFSVGRGGRTVTVVTRGGMGDFDDAPVPRAGLRMVADLGASGRLPGHHRLYAVRAHLLEMAGDHEAAVRDYRAAAARTTSLPERHHLTIRAARLGRGTGRG
ncbi:hypothetical protein [Streptomyces wuyuanensis]|uniref:hypothetical protein n=1 Tax=Streptomyces wuyuanensis TaxID=1196353 RepID=UPI003D747237